jgi:hypothetical protein
MDLIICFIDDSDFEHDLVRNTIAPRAPGLEFVLAYTFDEARERLGHKIPVLFLLDLWGQDEDVAQPYMTTKEELDKKVAGLNTLDAVYEGLEGFRQDRSNEYLKRLFTIVDGWRSLFEEICNRLGQNRKYGLRNIQKVRECYPGVPAVFYTRKSLISDAVAMFKAGADGLMIKPTGKDDEETRFLTGDYAPLLIDELSRIIDSRIDQLGEKGGSHPDRSVEEETIVKDLISGWKEFRNK